MENIQKTRPLWFAIGQGGAFALLWGCLMVACYWQYQLQISPFTAPLTSLLAGVGFGYAMFRIQNISQP